MTEINYEISIHAKPSRVWEVLWSGETYPQWTSVFDSESRAESDWKEGSKVLFHAANGHGMVSRIAKQVPYELMAFEHLGEIRNGVEDTESEDVKQWAGAMETYTLEDNGDTTTLNVKLDVSPQYKESFDKLFPKALGKVKELAEGGTV